jgi:predicted dehydrogenase
MTGSKKTRIGIIGAGWWAAENHIPVLQGFSDVELVAICRLGRSELERAKLQFEIPFGTEDYRELLQQGLDGVVVSSPHHLHYEHSAAALKAGVHVACEKPMTLFAPEAWELASIAEQRKLHFLMPYGWNYSELALNAYTAVKSGAVGEIQYIHCFMASALRDLFSGDGAWFADQAFFKPETRTWSDPEVGGGFAHGQLTHALGLLLYVTGLRAAEVFALMNVSKTGADLSDALVCRFGNGATATVGGCGTRPKQSLYQVDIRIFGTEGMLLLDIERPRLEVWRNDGRDSVQKPGLEPGAYSCVEPLRTFIDLIQGKKVTNRSDANLGARVVEILDAVFRSARSGRRAAVQRPDDQRPVPSL